MGEVLSRVRCDESQFLWMFLFDDPDRADQNGLPIWSLKRAGCYVFLAVGSRFRFGHFRFLSKCEQRVLKLANIAFIEADPTEESSLRAANWVRK